MRVRTMALLVLLGACSADASRPTPSMSATESAPSRDASGRYQLRFAGVPVGTTDLSLVRRAGGYRFRRDDRIAVRRDGERLDSVTSVIVDTNAELEAREVKVVSRVGSIERKSTAVRDDGGWVIRDAIGQISRRSGIDLAEIAMLTPSRARRREPMLVAGASFALVELDASRGAGESYHVALNSDIGRSTVEVMLDDDGLPKRWGSDSGESAIRTDGVAPPLEPAELLALASMPSEGRRSNILRVRGTNRAPPPSAAGQITVADEDGWSVHFESRRRNVPADLAAMVIGVDERIEDDLTAPGLSGSEALRMGRGDCSGHASALAMLVREAGYRAMLATGYRRRGGQWLRHRWTLVELDNQWVSLDPSFGESRPARSRLLLMAIHEPSADAMALADLVAFSGMSTARAAFQ